MARALHLARRESDFPGPEPFLVEAWDDLTEAARVDLRCDARAAIEAMREPTEAMVKASGPAFKEVNDMVAFCHVRGSHPGGIKADPVPVAYRAMIDAALSEP